MAPKVESGTVSIESATLQQLLALLVARENKLFLELGKRMQVSQVFVLPTGH